jgi:diguanylate cyclase (GGDEF)-like protein/putative nucleotidyltransferase with HDIG domain
LRDLPVAARVYTLVVIATGAILLVTLGPRATFDQPLLFAALLVLSAVSAVYKVNLPLTDGGSTISLSYAVDFTALLLLGPHETMLVSLASAWCQCTLRVSRPNPLHRTLFSMATLAITVQIAGGIFGLLGGTPALFIGDVAVAARPLVAAAAAYFVVNTLLVALAIALATSQSVLETWNQNFLWSAPSYFVGAAVAIAAQWTLQGWGVWMALLLIAPLYVTHRTYRLYLGRLANERRHVQELADLHLATIEALALAIDAKEQMGQSHIRRLQAYASALAKALGMSADDVQGVKTAALLHDIGKLAVPEHILSKPGPLTHEEFQKIRIHPQIGAEIISAVPFPYPVAPLILSHHERWDGKGYPQGLRRDEIPLGARILSVVDQFDALTSDRPYHGAMSHEAAIAVLREEAGKALDPAVVDTFIGLLPQLAVEVQRLENTAAPPAATRSAPLNPHPAPGWAGDTRTTVFENIAHAHREIYALYELAQSLGTSLRVTDTMGLISTKLSTLVPFTSSALFLYDERHDTLRCHFASGTEADVLGTMTIGGGEGLAGWVAHNRRTVLNARPSADFEAAGLSTHPTSLTTALVAPLVFHDRLIGTLAVYHAIENFYTDDHRRLLERVCEQAAAVIHNSLVFEQTQEDSLTDPLTGLPNTRFMVMHLSRELARAERLKTEVAVLLMDLDNFKDINDTHGHQAGDRALRAVARVLRQVIRPYDICVRYAGDEFIVVLSGCGKDEAEQKRLELQQAVQLVEFEAHPGVLLSLGLSIGAAVYPYDGEDSDALLAAADARMYRDKHGRKQGRLPFAATGTDDLPIARLGARA